MQTGLQTHFPRVSQYKDIMLNRVDDTLIGHDTRPLVKFT